MRGLSLVAASGGHSSSRCAGLSLSRPLLCGAQAPDAQAQQLWLTGPVAPRHVGSSQTRARTRVPCIGGRTLNHCATREALGQWLSEAALALSLYVLIFVSLALSTQVFLCLQQPRCPTQATIPPDTAFCPESSFLLMPS